MLRGGELLAVLVDQKDDLGVGVLTQPIQDRRKAPVIRFVQNEIGDWPYPEILPEIPGVPGRVNLAPALPKEQEDRFAQ